MIALLREWYNNNFTSKKYTHFLNKLDSKYPGAIEFRVAETPIFLDREFTNKLLSACESIVDVITQINFKFITKDAVPPQLVVPGQSNYPNFIAFDFGVCENENGVIEPQLIEMQGFPSLFGYQIWHDEITREVFDIPENYSPYLSGLDKESYIQLLKEIIIEDQLVESVILLELFPDKQKTRVDFYFTKEYTGINIVCLTELVVEANELFYYLDGKKVKVTRIYNRIIFDELAHQPIDIQEKGKIFFQELDVEWVPNPKWFFKISKYTLPFINHPYIPKTIFLDDLKEIPVDLENYVLKPLFSFAGQGVVIDVTEEDIKAIKDPHNWIFQRKVKYAEAIITPDIPAKAEVRIFYFWKKGEGRPIATNNLARLSKGKMIGVRYNADKEWVGGSLAYFEK